MNGSSRRRRSRGIRALYWLIAPVVFLVEDRLLVHKAFRDVVGRYPRFFDQDAYLIRTYELFALMKGSGFWHGLWQGLCEVIPNGITISPEAACLMRISGPPRIACLTLNFLYFFLVQALLVWAVRRRTGSVQAALVGWGLLMSAGFPYFWAGGIFDFRIDFAAACLYGVLYSLIVASDYFSSRAWSVGVAACAALLILTRFITSVYLAALLVFLLMFLSARIAFRLGPAGANDRRRLVNATVSGIVAALATTPALLHNRIAIFGYYYTGAQVAQGSIRSRELGLSTLGDHLVFYPRSLALDHLGPVFLGIAAAIVAAMAIGSLLKRPLPSPARFPRPRRDLLPAAVAAAFILIPIIALTALPSKSPVVAGICAVPAAIACALAYHRCAGRVFGPAMRAFLSLAACAAGILAFAFHIRSDRPDDSYGRAIGRLYSSIVRLADRRGVSTPRIGFLTTNDDAFFSGSLNVWAYENLGRLLRATDALGGIQMFSATSGEILSGLDAADIILLPDHPVSGIYPFDASIARDFGMIRTYCRDNMTVGEVVDVPGDSISVCARVFLSPVDLSGTWVTSDGCRFPLPRLDKRGPLRVRAEFRVPEYAHYRDLRASVSRLAAGGSDGVAQGTLSWRTARGAPNLALEVEMPGAAFDGREFLGIKFNRFFVPKELGLNNDIRRLSVEFVRAYIVSE